jgi:uncharacterized RDD family membrane protein YckC
MNERMWYYSTAGQQEGPVTEGVLVEMFQSHRLRRDTLVWTKELTNWVKASSVDGLIRPNEHTHPPPISAAGNRVSCDLYAGFWKRYAAALIDCVILMISGFVIGGVFGFIYGATTGTAEGVEFFATIIGIVLDWLYSALLESSAKQATLGKMALGIKVTDLDGNPISFGKASGRHFGKIVSVLIVFIGYIMIAFTERKQGLHDMMAGCLVVNK